MLETIKRISQATGEAGTPAAVMYAQVLQAAPLVVEVDSRYPLTAEFLVLLEGVPAPAVGDKLALLRNAGGKEFIVLGKVR